MTGIFHEEIEGLSLNSFPLFNFKSLQLVGHSFVLAGHFVVGGFLYLGS